jgi:hypothetical protein
MKDYHRAGAYLKEAMAVFRRLENTNGIVEVLNDQVRLAMAQGDRPEARLHAQLLRKIYEYRGQDREAAKLEELLSASKH